MNRFGLGNLDPLETVPDTAPSRSRDEVQSDIAAYLAKGGRITQAFVEPLHARRTNGKDSRYSWVTGGRMTLPGSFTGPKP